MRMLSNEVGARDVVAARAVARDATLCGSWCRSGCRNQAVTFVISYTRIGFITSTWTGTGTCTVPCIAGHLGD